jgi:hypothetical protein
MKTMKMKPAYAMTQQELREIADEEGHQRIASVRAEAATLLAAMRHGGSVERDAVIDFVRKQLPIVAAGAVSPHVNMAAMRLVVEVDEAVREVGRIHSRRDADAGDHLAARKKRLAKARREALADKRAPAVLAIVGVLATLVLAVVRRSLRMIARFLMRMTLSGLGLGAKRPAILAGRAPALPAPAPALGVPAKTLDWPVAEETPVARTRPLPRPSMRPSMRLGYDDSGYRR